MRTTSRPTPALARFASPVTAVLLAVALVAAQVATVVAAEEPLNYVPRSGTSVVNKDYQGNKFINQFFKWPSNWSMKRLKDYATTGIEIQTVFHCTTSCWVARCGEVKSWDSNLPSAYRDTPLGDNCSYPQPTVGSSITSNLVVNRNYSVFIRPYTSGTVGAGEAVRVRYSLTHKEPIWCGLGPEWCMFDLDGRNVINWTQHTHGVKGWTFP